jgi:hypothetical protein
MRRQLGVRARSRALSIFVVTAGLVGGVATAAAAAPLPGQASPGRTETVDCPGLGSFDVALPAGTPTTPLPTGVVARVGFHATDSRTGVVVDGGHAAGAIACTTIPFTDLTIAAVASGPAPAGVAPGDRLTGSWVISVSVDVNTEAPAAPAASPSAAAPAQAPFVGNIQSYLATRGGSASVAVFDATDGITYTVAPQNSYVTASIVKVDILATLLRKTQVAGRGLTSQEQATATQMIEFSDNSAATALWNEDGGGSGVASFNSLIPLPSTFPGSGGLWGLTRTTAADQVALVRQVAYPNAILGPAQRAYQQGLMENVTPSQRWGVSGGVPGGVTVALKNGWLPVSGGWAINSIGHIFGGGKDYVIAVLSSGNPSMGYGITTIQGVSSLVWSGLSTVSTPSSSPKPVVARNSNGMLQVFAITASGHLLTSWEAGPSRPFGGWLDMGMPAVGTGTPAVGAGRSGALQVFVHTTDNRLLTSWQTGPSQPFGGWLDMGLDGQINDDPAVGLNSNLALEVFVQGSSGRELTSWQTGPDQPFGGWLDLGLPGRDAGVPGVGLSPNGAMQMFVHTTDNRLLTSWQGGPSQPFGGWLDLGLDSQIAGDPSVGLNSDGTLEVFVQGTGGRVLTSLQEGVSEPFGGWQDLGLPAHEGGAPAVGTNQNGALQVFVHTTDNRLLISWQSGPSQPFGGWLDLGLGGQIASDPSAGSNTNGTMEVFVRGPAGGTLTSWQTGPNQAFGGWLSLGMPS